MTDETPEQEARACLAALAKAIAALYGKDAAAARAVMADVSSFETDWWGTHGDLQYDGL